MAINRKTQILTSIGVWSLLFLLLYVLRSFFLLIFLTFVFSYIQSNFVNKLASRLPNRTARVILVFVLFLGLLAGIGAFVVPPVKFQAEQFARNIPSYLKTLDQRLLALSEDYPLVKDYLPERSGLLTYFEDRSEFSMDNSVTVALVQKLLDSSAEGDTRGLSEALVTVRDVGSKLLAAGSAFLLSLLFSFLIVLDLEKLTKSVLKLRESRLRFAFEEVAQSIYDFSHVMGKALEAQLGIALLNTLLTAIGIVLLGQVDKVAFLSLIVFLCSFIPVAGVFISSVPICLVEIQEAGIAGLFITAGLITVIHLIEAYILNPKIYGHHLRMNPVLVLIILTIGGKLFHVWGLILGVPVCTYLFGHAIWPKGMRERIST